MGALCHGRLRFRLEFQGKGVDAVAGILQRQVFSGEDVAQMGAAMGARDLRAPSGTRVDAPDENNEALNIRSRYTAA
jgi:hypothetical protein